MRWTVGIYPVKVVLVGNAPKPSILSHDTMGWDGQLGFTQWGWYQLGTFLNRLSCPMAQWDGMDITQWEWYQLRTLLNSPSCPVVQRDGMLVGFHDGNSWDVPKLSIQSSGTLGLPELYLYSCIYMYIVQWNGIRKYCWTPVGNAEQLWVAERTASQPPSISCICVLSFKLPFPRKMI